MPPIPTEVLGNPVRLIITDDTFNQDYIAQAGPFCSKRLRDIFDLEPTTVQYIPIDDTACSQIVRNQNYMLMRLLARESVIDLARSDTLLVPFDDEGRPAEPRVVFVKSVVFREGAKSRFPLFADPNDQKIYATDEFAEKVLRARIGDVCFQDIVSEEARSGAMVFKAIE
jgi:hypothetical protein